MSRTVRRNACRALLLAVALFALTLVMWPALVFAQASYTWRNVQIYGGGFITGIVFNQTDCGDGTAVRWTSAIQSRARS